MLKVLYIIPARGGSKGIPNKNIKRLGDKPLICYSIDIAKQFAKDEDICVTTDSDIVINIVNNCGLVVPFKRPGNLGSDTAGTYEVIIHALNYYESIGIRYEAVILLQPTSPFRKKIFISDIIDLYTSNANVEMVVSVSETHVNPYFSLFEENALGFLEKSKSGNFTRRQDAPKVYAFNGSIYMCKVEALKNYSISEFTRIRKYVLDEYYSLDIDSMMDWYMAELLLEKKLVSE